MRLPEQNNFKQNDFIFLNLFYTKKYHLILINIISHHLIPFKML